MRNTKIEDIKRDWHLLDANGKILGRFASEVAHLIMGKNKPYFAPHLDCGDYVVVINAQSIKLSGKKEIQKKYFHHSGYPGGLRAKTAATLRAEKPEELIRHSVFGMVPKNKLGKSMLKKLYIYPQSENPHQDKFKN